MENNKLAIVLNSAVRNLHIIGRIKIEKEKD